MENEFGFIVADIPEAPPEVPKAIKAHVRVQGTRVLPPSHKGQIPPLIFVFQGTRRGSRIGRRSASPPPPPWRPSDEVSVGWKKPSS